MNDRAFELWVEYFNRTEDHDRAVCALKNERGVAIPTTKRERILVTHNASERRKELLAAARELDIPRDVLEGAKREALDHHHRTYVYSKEIP